MAQLSRFKAIFKARLSLSQLVSSCSKRRTDAERDAPFNRGKQGQDCLSPTVIRPVTKLL